MQQPFQITIPADKLVDKVNAYPITLWVLLKKTDDTFIDLLTSEEKDAFVKTSNWEDNDSCTTRIEKVELTLKDLLQQEPNNEN